METDPFAALELDARARLKLRAAVADPVHAYLLSGPPTSVADDAATLLAAALAGPLVAGVAAVQRAAKHAPAAPGVYRMIDAQGEDFVRTARSKGIGEQRVLLRHVLRTSLIVFVSLFGLDFAALVGGSALLTEVVFGLPGIGLLTYQSLQNLDLPVIMAIVIYAAFFVVFANAVVDIVYAFLDPRIRPT